jgi:hypothetical protein
MPLPDPLPFFGANQATFNSGGGEKVGINQGLALFLRKVALSPRFT